MVKENLTNQIQSQVGLIRLFLEGEHQHEFDNGSMLEPKFTVGVRGENYDQNSIVGLEAESKINYQITEELYLKGQGRLQVLKEGENSKYYFLGEFGYNQGVNGLELKLGWKSSDRTDPSIGSAKFLTSENFVHDLTNHHYSSSSTFNTKLRYGINLLDEIWRITPFTTYSVNSIKEREFQFGSQVQIGRSLDFELISQFNYIENRSASQQLKFIGKLSF